MLVGRVGGGADWRNGASYNVCGAYPGVRSVANGNGVLTLARRQRNAASHAATRQSQILIPDPSPARRTRKISTTTMGRLQGGADWRDSASYNVCATCPGIRSVKNENGVLRLGCH